MTQSQVMNIVPTIGFNMESFSHGRLARAMYGVDMLSIITLLLTASSSQPLTCLAREDIGISGNITTSKVL